MGIIDDAIQAADLIEDRIGRAAEATQKAQEAARELREALSDTRQATRDLEAVETRVVALVQSSVGELISQKVAEGLEEFGNITEASMRKSVAKVNAEFDGLRDILMGAEKDDGKKSIPAMIDDMERALRVKWPVFMRAVRAAAAVSAGCSDEKCTKDPEYAVLVLMTLPDGTRGEAHFHLCAEHKKLMNNEGTILRTYKLEAMMCPWPHTNPDTVKIFEDTT
jgi:hypothetical protein